MQIDKQTIEPMHPLTLLPFLKNDEQTKQAEFQNLSKALARSCLKTKNVKNSGLSRILSGRINHLPKNLARIHRNRLRNPLRRAGGPFITLASFI